MARTASVTKGREFYVANYAEYSGRVAGTLLYHERPQKTFDVAIEKDTEGRWFQVSVGSSRDKVRFRMREDAA